MAKTMMKATFATLFRDYESREYRCIPETSPKSGVIVELSQLYLELCCASCTTLRIVSRSIEIEELVIDLCSWFYTATNVNRLSSFSIFECAPESSRTGKILEFEVLY